MPKMIIPLTDTKIKSVITQQRKKAEKTIKLSDGQGLYLYIDKLANAYWRFDYTRPITKKRNTISIGKYPEITLAQARTEREKYRTHIARNIDPSVEKKREELELLHASGITFEYVAREFMKTEVLAEGTKKRNAFSYQYLFNAIGKRPIDEITAQELLAVIQLHDSLGHNETARRMRSKASQVFRYALALGWCIFKVL